jgi:hypothetical protein
MEYMYKVCGLPGQMKIVKIEKELSEYHEGMAVLHTITNSLLNKREDLELYTGVLIKFKNILQNYLT